MIDHNADGRKCLRLGQHQAGIREVTVHCLTPAASGQLADHTPLQVLTRHFE